MIKFGAKDYVIWHRVIRWRKKNRMLNSPQVFVNAGEKVVQIMEQFIKVKCKILASACPVMISLSNFGRVFSVWLVAECIPLEKQINSFSLLAASLPTLYHFIISKIYWTQELPVSWLLNHSIVSIFIL